MTRLAFLAIMTASLAAAADDDHTRAAKQFAAGERAFADADYLEALRLFREANTLSPEPAVRFNIAVCLERLGRFREAALEYDTAAASTSLTDDVRARAGQDAASMRSRLGKLAIAGSPAGAAVRVDGTPTCALPCTIEVDPGRHEIVAEAGVASARAAVEVARGGTAEVSLDATIHAPARRGVGALTYAGGTAAAVGTAGAIYFGLRTRSLHDDYVANPMAGTRDDGLNMRLYTNVSIGVVAAGAIALGIDLFILSRREDKR